MKNQVYEKLNNIENLEDRLILKKILSGLFTSLEEYTENRFNELEKRVFNEIEDIKEKYNVFCTIAKRGNLDPTNEFLYPMLKEDVEEAIYDVNEILNNLRENQPITMFKVFLKCDYLRVKDILDSNKTFKGVIETDKKTYEAYFSLKENKEYIEKTKDIYKMFINNNIPWTTINNPYIYKIANVVLTTCKENIGEDEEINKISIDFEEYAEYIQYDMVPLWNIKGISLKSLGFPMPCEDKVTYEHMISIEKEGKSHGYLVNYEGANIQYVRFMKDSLVICSSEEEGQKWSIYKIISRNPSAIDIYNHELMCNEARDSFIGKLSLNNRCNVKTRSELERIINSFKVYKYLEFKHLELKEKEEGKINSENVIKPSETYTMNEFIIDEIRDGNRDKVLTLYFRGKDNNYYLNRDILSFLLSEIQLFYPEYHCEGRLI
ncbi:normocyte-binding protein [Clostridium sp.]|uniref:normocyte-binding protein n=1 Tax=Clostridium sp. TaxID=1506 RepID=UPI003463FEF2